MIKNKSRPPFLCFDIGGTKIRCSVCLDGVTIEPPLIIPTPKLFNDGMNEVRKWKEIWKDVPFTFAVGGVAGNLDKQKGILHISPNLPKWSGQNIKDGLTKALGVPVIVENDAALVGLGEAIRGAGKGHNIVVYITISTGVNGVRVVNSKIDANISGFEIGHQIINFDVNTHFDNFGQGTLEDYIGGAAIEKREGKPTSQIDSEPFWDNITRILAIGMNNTLVHWSPEVVVLGGAIGSRISLEKLHRYLSDTLAIFHKLPVLKKSTLGDLGGLYGSIEFVKGL